MAKELCRMESGPDGILMYYTLRFYQILGDTRTRPEQVPFIIFRLTVDAYEA
jgi:hypothetical protein